MERLAEKLATKMQDKLVASIYADAGRNLFDVFKKALWASVIALAAWGASRYGGGQG
jgi:hypothetical protein